MSVACMRYAEADAWVPELANPTPKLAADTSCRKAAGLDMSALCVPRAAFMLCPRKCDQDVKTEKSLGACVAPFKSSDVRISCD